MMKIASIFAAAFAAIYVAAVQFNWAFVTYHPALGEWDLLTQPPRSGPAMYWYGWLITTTLGASAVSLASLPLTRRFALPVWPGWAIPLLAMAIFVYLFRGFFLR